MQELKDVPPEDLQKEVFNQEPPENEPINVESKETTFQTESAVGNTLQEIRTFSPKLYQQVEMNVETLEMLSQMKAQEPTIAEE